MSCEKQTPAVQRHLVSVSTTAVYEWLTEWIPAAGFERWKAILKQTTPDSTFNSTFAKWNIWNVF